jgi:hypothetical protein
MMAKAMQTMRTVGPLLAAVLTALVLAACGSSGPSHSSEVSKLHKTLTSNPKNFGIPVSLPVGVVGCMTDHAGKLSTSDLTLINGVWKVASQPTHSQFAGLLGACLTPAATKQLEQAFGGAFQVPGAAQLSSCYQTQLTSVSAASFDPFLVAAIGGTPAQKAAATTRLSGSIGAICLQKPAVLDEVRQLFAAGARGVAARVHAPAAYTACVLRVASAITPAQAEPLLSQATSPAASKQLAKPCASLL